MHKSMTAAVAQARDHGTDVRKPTRGGTGKW